MFGKKEKKKPAQLNTYIQDSVGHMLGNNNYPVPDTCYNNTTWKDKFVLFMRTLRILRGYVTCLRNHG